MQFCKKPTKPQSHTGQAILALVFCLLLLPGCARVEQKPFAEFHASMATMRTTADSLAEDIQASTAAQWSEHLAATKTLPADLRLLNPAQTPEALAAPADVRNRLQFTVDMTKAPLHMKAAVFRSSLANLNAGLAGYAQALVNLSTPELTGSTVDQLATDVNANVRAARDALNLKDRFSNDSIAIFSTAATEAFRGYLQHKQRGKLTGAMREAQPGLEQVSRLGQEAALIMAVTSWEVYADQTQPLLLVLAAPSSSSDQKLAVAKRLDAINQAHVSHLAALGALYQAYAKIPQVHESLITGMDSDSSLAAKLQELAQEIKRISALYESLRNAK